MARALILVNLGTPAAPTPEAVRAFLGEFLADRRVVDWPRWLWLPILRGIVLRTRPARTAAMYGAIWRPEGSPLAVGTARLAAGLQELVGDEVDVSFAYRYGAPRLDTVIEEAASRADEIRVLPLFPQRTASSRGTVEELARATAAKLGLGERLELVALEPDEPGYVDSLAERVEATFRRFESAPPDHLLISFHGIPRRVDRKEGGLYSADCERTARALLDTLDWEPARATLAYQSRFGPERWLGPATADELARLPARGARRIAIATPGFLTPGLETIEELGLRGRRTFLAAGGKELRLVDPPGDHPLFLQALARKAGP